jgi:hypothetical protein
VGSTFEVVVLVAEDVAKVEALEGAWGRDSVEGFGGSGGRGHGCIGEGSRVVS